MHWPWGPRSRKQAFDSRSQDSRSQPQHSRRQKLQAKRAAVHPAALSQAICTSRRAGQGAALAPEPRSGRPALQGPVKQPQPIPPAAMARVDVPFKQGSITPLRLVLIVTFLASTTGIVAWYSLDSIRMVYWAGAPRAQGAAQAYAPAAAPPPPPAAHPPAWAGIVGHAKRLALTGLPRLLVVQCMLGPSPWCRKMTC